MLTQCFKTGPRTVHNLSSCNYQAVSIATLHSPFSSLHSRGVRTCGRSIRPSTRTPRFLKPVAAGPESENNPKNPSESLDPKRTSDENNSASNSGSDGKPESQGKATTSASGTGGNFFSRILSFPFFPQLGPFAHKLSLNDIFGRTNHQVMLFLGFGVLSALSLITWAAGSTFYREKPYTFHIVFPEADGIQSGVPLRLKGVRVGEVQNVEVDLFRVYAEVEVFLGATLIPRPPHCTIEYNRTGIVTPEPFIDISVPSRMVEASGNRELSPKRQQQLQQQQQLVQQETQDNTSYEGDINIQDATQAVASTAGSWDEDGSEGVGSGSAQPGVGSADLQFDALPASAAAGGDSDGTGEAGDGAGEAGGVGESVPEVVPLAKIAAEGNFIEPGERVYGKIGASTDIISRMTVKSNRGPDRVQKPPAMIYGDGTTNETPL